jgi:hypothetical protein
MGTINHVSHGEQQMSYSKILPTAAAAAILALGALASSATPSDAKDSSRFRCDARGPAGTQLHANYEKRERPGRDRQIFSAEFEAKPGRGYTAGQHVNFSVDSVPVGSATLKLVLGELVAELELDTNDIGVKKPIPPNFPAIESGVVVEAIINRNVVLGCELSPN